jgi:adenylate cyclase class 2
VLHPVEDSYSLQSLLTQALGVKVIVKKNRKIFFLQHTKFHIDEVPGLGHFIEIEVSNLHHPHLEEAQMQLDCREYMRALDIREEDLVAVSYSDMLLEQESRKS